MGLKELINRNDFVVESNQGEILKYLESILLLEELKSDLEGIKTFSEFLTV